MVKRKSESFKATLEDVGKQFVLGIFKGMGYRPPSKPKKKRRD